MEAEAGDAPRHGGSWAPGKVAEMLGVSPVTLRTWNARYGAGPTLRADGRHRRYSDADVRRLRHMQRLIERGMRAREAAAAVFSGAGETTRREAVPGLVAELTRAAGALHFGSLAALLDEALLDMGAAATWTEVLAPILREFGRRWQCGDVCFASEWALTSETSLALERHSVRFADPAPGRVVLLACCPGERHTLPMEVLRAALAERGVPAVFLGPMASPETIAAMASTLDPRPALLWSTSPATVDDPLRQRLAHQGVTVEPAGSGWGHLADRGLTGVDTLTGALDLVAAHQETPRTGNRCTIAPNT
ncbi:MerR family transcriptional regulator [Amycolatopsis samaneae]